MGLLSISGLTLEQWPSLDTSVVAWRHELLSISRLTPERSAFSRLFESGRSAAWACYQ
jgi:hypothetical protein